MSDTTTPTGADGLAYAARRVVSHLDDGRLDTSILPPGMGGALRELRNELDKANAGYTRPAAPVGGDGEAVAQAIEERDQAREELRLLSQKMIYEGNSVSCIASKAKNYGNALLEAWDALKSIGVPCDGKTTVADAIRKHCATRPAAAGVGEER